MQFLKDLYYQETEISMTHMDLIVAKVTAVEVREVVMEVAVVATVGASSARARRLQMACCPLQQAS